METRGRANALHALRSRDVHLLWSGQTISLVGDGAYLVALGWKSFELTAAVAGSFSPATLLTVGFGLSMILWILRLASPRVRAAA